MINHAKIEIPDPNEQLSIVEAVRVIQAMAEDMLATEKYLARLEALLEHCQAYFRSSEEEWQRRLLAEIEEVLK